MKSLISLYMGTFEDVFSVQESSSFPISDSAVQVFEQRSLAVAPQNFYRAINFF